MTTLLAEGVDLSKLPTIEEGWMTPVEASTFAGPVDWLFYYIFWMSAVFFVLIVVLMFYFMWRYRRRTNNDPVGQIHHNTPLELAWSVFPGLLLVTMFWWGFTGFVDMRRVPENPNDVSVQAAKWNWSFTYPNGLNHPELHCVLNAPTRLVMTSSDVIHSCFIPAFRIKRDVVPGRYSELWFKPTKVGRTALLCAEYCGTSHSDMIAHVEVHATQEEYDEWLEKADPLRGMTDEQYAEYLKDPVKFIDNAPDELKGRVMPPADFGRELWARKGCNQCHSLDGKPGNGPTWKGLWGSQRNFTDGSSTTADENYVLESIRNPGKKLVQGYGPVMPTLNVSDREIDCLIAFIKTLK
ncbi:MAG: cytochrome c oxidase subunit II [Phycisphaerales bacterium]|nr:cytochrome c oxidase subunit II [Phycisphaerales bacterium]